MRDEYELVVHSDKYHPIIQYTRLFGQAIMNARTRIKVAEQVYGDSAYWYIRRKRDGVIIAQSK